MHKLIILGFSFFIFLSCENTGTTNSNNTDSHTETPVTTDTSTTNASESTAQIYTCPMHPEVTSDKPGKCPKCKMDLVLKSELDAEK